jgi:hypothetical protein
VEITEAIALIDKLVLTKQGRHLQPPEIVVLEAAWDDKDYKQMALNSGYSNSILQYQTAPKLWTLLTGILGEGEKVTKKRLRSILERRKLPSDGLEVAASNTSPPILQGQPPQVTNFSGRHAELDALKEQIVKQRCVVVIGGAGIGKTALVAKLIQELSAAPQWGFECLIWQSISYSPLLPDLVDELNQMFGISLEDRSRSGRDGVAVLIEQLRNRRSLVVLDGGEAILQGEKNNDFNPYGERYAEYRVFLRRLVEEQHQSCLILTTREPFEDLNLLELAKRPVSSLKVEGLDVKAARQFLSFHRLTNQEGCDRLIQTYRGNPSELEAVASRINYFFGGSLEKFFESKSTFLSHHSQAMLSQQFSRVGLLSDLQRQILIYLAEQLAKNPTPISFAQLDSYFRSYQNASASMSKLIEALEKLDRRSLIESSQNATTKEVSFTLSPVVKKYVLTDPLGLLRNSRTTVKSA